MCERSHWILCVLVPYITEETRAEDTTAGVFRGHKKIFTYIPPESLAGPLGKYMSPLQHQLQPFCVS